MTGSPAAPPQPHSILVIDDGADNRLLLSATLRRAGYDAWLAEDGEAGLLTLADRVPSLILLDYSMPGLSGPEVARVIRARPATAHVPVIILTASADEVHIDEAFASGADDYIVKPFERRIMLARIESLIRASADRVRAAAATEVEAELGQLRSDLKDASAVQRDQVSKLPVQFPDGTISGAMLPCTHVGGDLLQVLVGTRGTTIALVLDISGHGTAAALVAASAMAELRNLVASHALPAALAALSARIAATGSHYACVCAIELDATHITIVNAGLPPVCLIRGGALVQTVEGGGFPPGMFATAEYTAERIAWQRGDRLVVVSDGLTEPLGLADDLGPCLRALQLMPASGEQSSEMIVTRIRGLLGATDQEDDATVMIVDFTATSGSP